MNDENRDNRGESENDRTIDPAGAPSFGSESPNQPKQADQPTPSFPVADSETATALPQQFADLEPSKTSSLFTLAAGVSMETPDHSAQEVHSVETSASPENPDNLANVSDATILSDSPPYEIVRMSPDSTETMSLPKQFFATGVLPIGSQLGHFRITKYIGGGGMGRVYEAIDAALDRKVAIKVLPRQKAQDTASVARFLNEARSAARLNHEHIAQVYFCGEEGGIPYIAFEFVQGTNLRDYVTKTGVMPLAEAINFILQVSSALAHAASHGVTHRDVKPSNIIITRQGKAKLIDMGLARLLRPSDPNEDLTVSGVTLGTFDYISPEQARDPRNADVRSDIYSLGCTFFFMLTGQPPFPEGTVLQKLLKHQGDEPPDIRKFAPTTPPEIVAVVQKMMAKDPANRYQKPDDLIDDLVGIAESIGLTPTGPGKMDWAVPKIGKRAIFFRHLPWIAAVSLLLISVGVWRWYFFSGNEAALLRQVKSRSGPSVTESARPIIDTPSADLPPDSQTPPPATVPLAGRLLTTDDLSGSRPQSTIELVDLPAGGRVVSGWGGLPTSLSAVAADPLLAVLSQEEGRKISRLIGADAGRVTGSWNSVESRDAASPETTPTDRKTSEPTVLTVDRIGGRAGFFASLESAITQAMTAQKGREEEIFIELTGGDHEVPPLKLAGITLRIAARGAERPRLVFHPTPVASSGANSLFHLDSSRLTLENVSVQFVPPTAEKNEWAIFDVGRDSTVRLNGAILTIPARADSAADSTSGGMAFFRRGRESDFGTTGSLPGNLPEISATASSGGESVISLQRVFLRGEASVLALHGHLKARLEITATAMAVTGPTVVCDGRAGGPSNSSTAGITVILDRVVALGRFPLFREIRTETNAPNLAASDNSAPGDEPFTIKASLSRCIVKLADQPLGELIVPTEDDRSFAPVDWKIDDSTLFNVTALWRRRTSGNSDRFTDFPFTDRQPIHYESAAPESVEIEASPFHEITATDLVQFFLRSGRPEVVHQSFLTDPNMIQPSGELPATSPSVITNPPSPPKTTTPAVSPSPSQAASPAPSGPPANSP